MDTVDRGLREVYFNEFNVLMDGFAYFPLVSGLLQAYAQVQPGLSENYSFMPYLFHRDIPERILVQYQNPAVAAFSVSMWNEQLSLKIARQVKERFPSCLIVFGGAQVPHTSAAYRRMHPFIDVTVRGEGEQAFANVLTRFLESRDFSGLPGVSFAHPQTGEWIKNSEESAQLKELDEYPSPYLMGLFDSLLRDYPHIQFQAIIETNRGCPFPCTFCYWGWGGLNRKYRFFSLERIRAVLEWCARNRIIYVFNADSNFGMLPRDREIAESLVDIKARFGYPEKFRTCFGKNSDDKIFDIASLLHRHKLEKGITLARQSNDETTLENIRRQNIRLETYRRLQRRFDGEGIPVYVELILGLPGETYATWLKGLNEVLVHTGIKNQLFVYFCQIYPNTELDDPQYRSKFKIGTVTMPLNEIHGQIRADELLPEREEIIVSTYSMSRDDWKRMTLVSWLIQVLHGLKLGYYPLVYLVDRYQLQFTDFIEYLCSQDFNPVQNPVLCTIMDGFHRHLEIMLRGGGRGKSLPEFGNIYWDVEEAAFLQISMQKDQFYDEFSGLVRDFLDMRSIPYSRAEVDDVIAFQRFSAPSLRPPVELSQVFHHNFHDYFENLVTQSPLSLKPDRVRLTLVGSKDFGEDKKRFAREVLLFGRKSATLLYQVEPARASGQTSIEYSTVGVGAV